MKRIIIGLLCGILFLTACGQNSSATPTASISVIDTATPSPIPTNTNTSIPTETSTASITPLPTIPSFTPTFDARTIVTVTPAPKAECPKENSNLSINFQLPNNPMQVSLHDREIIKSILGFLNSGGAISSVISELQKAKWTYEYLDVTNDGLKDLIVDSGVYLPRVHILYCSAGKYLEFMDETIGSEYYKLFGIRDLNSNGIPDIVIQGGYYSGSGIEAEILEWDGNTFINISLNTDDNEIPLIDFGASGFDVKDTDKDGLFELILKGNVISQWYYVDYYKGAPWREETDTYSWNGKIFAKQSIEYVVPEYRFQAVQDGDRSTLTGEYKNALSFYQDTIFSDKLQWFSPERKKYIETIGGVYGKDITPQPLTPDTTEYPRLAAYAYYRIMLLHLVQGHEPEATTVYNTVGQKFGNDPYGHPYVEMATAFWNEYQSAHKMYDGCAAAIDYAVKHPEILTPLGSDYHGSQSHIYKPEDVCPFR